MAVMTFLEVNVRVGRRSFVRVASRDVRLLMTGTSETGSTTFFGDLVTIRLGILWGWRVSTDGVMTKLICDQRPCPMLRESASLLMLLPTIQLSDFSHLTMIRLPNPQRIPIWIVTRSPRNVVDPLRCSGHQHDITTPIVTKRARPTATGHF